MLENTLGYVSHHSTLLSIRIYVRLIHTLLGLRDENQLPTVSIKIRNYYPKSDFRLKRYIYTDTPLSEVPNLLTRVGPGSPDSFNMLKFKLLPSALVDTHEPHKFVLRYCCENDEKIGLHLSITVVVLKQPDEPLLVESFDRQVMPNSGVKYNARIFVEDDKHYYVKDYFCKEFGNAFRSAFTMTARHTLVSDTSPDSVIDLNIIPIHSQS
jgi:hypothetical protein